MNNRIKFIILAFIICSQIGNVWGQNKRVKLFGFDGGMDFNTCKKPDLHIISFDQMLYGTDDVIDYIKGLMYKNYVGLKIELRSRNDKFGLLGGIRYSHVKSSIGKNTNWSGPSSYFYVFLKQDATSTEYVKVLEFDQKSDYLGIPIEFRYFPFKLKNFRPYVKAGIEFNFLILTASDIVFYNDAMEAYQGDLLNMIDEPASFDSRCYLSFGFKLEKGPVPGINIELSAPSVYLTPMVSSLVKPTAASGGFQLNLQFPF